MTDSLRESGCGWFGNTKLVLNESQKNTPKNLRKKTTY